MGELRFEINYVNQALLCGISNEKIGKALKAAMAHIDHDEEYEAKDFDFEEETAFLIFTLGGVDSRLHELTS